MQIAYKRDLLGGGKMLREKKFLGYFLRKGASENFSNIQTVSREKPNGRS